MSDRFCSCVRRATGSLLLAALVAAAAPAQTPRAPSYARPTLVVAAGVTGPLSHESLTDFWLRGPGGSVAFTLDVQRNVALGIELGGSVFYFDQAAFASRYPGVAMNAQNAGMIDALLLMKVLFAPRMILAPYGSVLLGATHWTGASYKEEIPGQPRRIFYDIPRATKLATGLALGADIVTSTWLAFVVEARATYIVNDPALGLTASLRGGVRLRL